MHRLIEHFQRIAPTWLLLETDWASTQQAAPFMPYCSDIVTIGRVKWIEGSKYTGKDNHAWFRFDARHRGGPVFHGRDQSEMFPSRRTRMCEQCRKSYEPQRSSSRFCSEGAGSTPIARGCLALRLALRPHHRTYRLNHRIPWKCFAKSDTQKCQFSRRKVGNCCLHSMAPTTVNTRC